MEEAIRDVFPYGPAELIIMYTAAAIREDLHAELLRKIKLPFFKYTYSSYYTYEKYGCLALDIAKATNDTLPWIPWISKGSRIYHAHKVEIFKSEQDSIIKHKFPVWPRMSRCEIPEPIDGYRLTKQTLINYLQENGFRKLKSSLTKKELIKLTLSF